MFKQQQTKNFQKSNTIQSLPFDELAKIDKASRAAAIDNFIASHALKSKPWLYPQATAHIAKWKVFRTDSKYNGKDIVVENCRDSLFDRGLWLFLMSDRRAIDKQYLQGEFCALTPLILAAHKKMNGIGYYEWGSLEYVVNSSLLEAMTTEVPDYSVEELLEWRNIGLTAKTGKSAGVTKSAISTYGIYGLDKELGDGRCGLGSFNQLVRMMLVQTWCAHPSNRNQYSILDPNAWETVPEPLISEEPLPKKAGKFELEDLW